MKDPALRGLADSVGELGTRVAQHLTVLDRWQKTPLDRMRDHEVGHPQSPSFEAGAGASPVEDLPDELRGRISYNDPTGSAGVQVAMRGDQAVTDRKNLERDLLTAQRALQRAAETLARYEPRKANAIERLEDKADPGCQSCSRIPGPGSVGLPKSQQTPWWNEVARNVTLANGQQVGLCEWCRARARETGEMPAVQDVESYRDTGRARKRTA